MRPILLLINQLLLAQLLITVCAAQPVQEPSSPAPIFAAAGTPIAVTSSDQPHPGSPPLSPPPGNLGGPASTLPTASANATGPSLVPTSGTHLPSASQLPSAPQSTVAGTQSTSWPHSVTDAGWTGPASTASQALPSPALPQIAPASATAAAPRKLTPLEPPKAGSGATDSSSQRGGTLQMVLSVGSSLLIVIGAFLGVVWFYRKTIDRTTGGIPKEAVAVLGRMPIAARQQLLLLRFGSKLVLVSLVQGEARTLSEITDPLEVDQLAGFCESHKTGSISHSFRSILEQAGGGAK